MQRALGQTNATMAKIERRTLSMNQRLSAGFIGVQRGIAGAFAGAVALRGAQQLIDASTRIENSLKVAGLAGEELSSVYDRLFASAQRNAAPVESLVTLYGRATLVQKELGASTEDLLGFTDNVALALRVAGTDAQTASGALLQLSQALGSGTVRAEEFNSIQEGALPVLQAVAAGLAEAGGSVAKLRGLVIDGKVSSEAFFRAFEAGSVVLQEKVANAELTVSQGFVRLQNVLIDTAGKFDTATGASTRTGTALDAVARYIENIGRTIEQNGGNIQKFMDLAFGTGSERTVADDILEWSRAMGQVFKGNLIKGSADEMEALSSAFDRYGESVTDAELRTAQAEQALVNFGLNTKGQFGTLQPVVDDFIQQLLEGRGTAESAAEAINAIGAAGDFGALIGQLGGVVSALIATRDAAVATAAAVAAAERGETAGTNIAGQRAEQQSNRPKPVVKPVSITDYLPPGGGGGGSGGGRSATDRYGDDVSNMERRIASLQRETELRRGMPVLINDYGYAVERLNAQMELENAATEAGLQLTPQRQEQIRLLSEGYAQATSDAARLAEAQDLVRQSAEEMAQAGRAALDTIIDGFLEGKDAGEVLNSVFKDLARSLLNMGLNALGGGIRAGGFNPLSFLGFASGTANTGGRRGEPRGVVHGQEAVIPLPSGGRVPVELRAPSRPSASNTAHIAPVTNVFQIDAKGAEIGVEEKIVGAIRAIVPGMIKTGAPPAVAGYQQQRSGGDYRG